MPSYVVMVTMSPGVRLPAMAIVVSACCGILGVTSILGTEWSSPWGLLTVKYYSSMLMAPFLVLDFFDALFSGFLMGCLWVLFGS